MKGFIEFTVEEAKRYQEALEEIYRPTGMNVCNLIEWNMDGIDLLLEYVSESTKAYNQLDIHGWSSQEDMFRKIIIADSIIHNQSKIIDKLTKIR